LFRIINKSIFNINEILEYKVYLDDINNENIKLYKGNTIKGTNIKNGNGIELFFNNILLSKFEGEYLNGERNGKGKYYDDYEEYIGVFLNDEINGNIQIFRNFGNKPYLLFDGEYSKGKKIKGKEYDKDGHLLFNGKYANNLNPLQIRRQPFPKEVACGFFRHF
jgi:hypothetical protein